MGTDSLHHALPLRPLRPSTHRLLFFSLLLQWYNRFIGPALERMHDRSMLFPTFEAVHPPVTLLTPAPADSPSRKHIVLLGRSVLVPPPFRFFSGKQSKGHHDPPFPPSPLQVLQRPAEQGASDCAGAV